MSRPKSTIPNSRTMRIGAISENSTIPCDRCGSRRQAASSSRTSVTADRHVRVRDDVDRVAEDALHEARGEPKAHDKNHVYVGAFETVIGRRPGKVETRRVGVADVQQRG